MLMLKYLMVFSFPVFGHRESSWMLGFLSFVGHDPDDVAFPCVEVQLSGVFPLFQGVKVLLK